MEFTAEDKKMRLTPLQAALLKKIATDEMTCVNGAEPESIPAFQCQQIARNNGCHFGTPSGFFLN